jgi:hypothetical protein
MTLNFVIKFQKGRTELDDADRWRTDNYDVVFEYPDMDGLRGLAVHESGHGVCATNLGLVVTSIEIDGFNGSTFVRDYAWARPNVRLFVLMAGVEAERQCLRTEMVMRPHDNSDRQRVADVLALIDRREWPFALAQARQGARRMVRTHRSTVLRVANALLERCAVAGEPRGRLDGDALIEALGGAEIAVLRAAARPR